MISIPGYEIVSEIYKGTLHALYKAVRTVDSSPVTLKVATFQETSDPIFGAFEREFSTGYQRFFNSVLKYTQKTRFENKLILEMEPFDGLALEHWLVRQRPLSQRIEICIALVKTLEELHYANIIHCDLQPAHFLIKPQTLEIKLTNLSPKSETELEYMSPEQSGRMNIKEDYRSDYYALGVAFYRIFTGRLPFAHSDPNELVHSHIAKQPILPSVIDPEIPAVVSELVMRLLEKKPEARYQTTKGIRHDLKACLDFCPSGRATPFQARRFDTPGRFEIPGRLYGREPEIQNVLNAFQRASSKNEMLLVYGNSGIGKSSLVAEVQDILTCRGALFATGKFDQYVENIPFEAVIEAFDQLITQISAVDPEALRGWKCDIMQAMGAYGQVIVDVIPKLEFIIGKQAEVPPLAPVEAQNRFINVFTNFINVFTKKEHPLVIFLDDLQWADTSSLRFLSRVMGSVEGKYLFIIGSYRDNEVPVNHPLAVTIREMEESGANFRQLGLFPLTTGQISSLISDTFSCPLHIADTLAEPISSRTLGNPFFINETLRSLYKDGLIHFDQQSKKWLWDAQSIIDYADSGSSQELLTNKINRLSEHAKQALTCAACIGKEFNLEMLSALNDKTPQETGEDLKEAITENLVLVSMEKPKTDRDKYLFKTRYTFIHDQVQQAAYALLSGERKQELHLDIGYFMLERLSPHEIDNQLFSIVNHLNFGAEIIDSDSQKYKIAQLNFDAGKKAKTSAAYSVALEYFRTGMRFLNEKDWNDPEKLFRNLHTEYAECAYLTGDIAATERLTATLLDHAKSVEERMNASQLRIQALIFSKNLDGAIRLSLTVLAELGIKFPSVPNNFHILTAYGKSKWHLRGLAIEDLENLPPMQDARMLAAMRILQNITAIAFVRIPLLYPLMVLKMVGISVRYGNAPESALTYITYGAIVNAIETQNPACYRFGKTGLKLLEGVSNIAIKERTTLVFNIVSRSSGEHISHSLEPLKRAFKVGIELGDIEYCAYASSSYSFFLLLSGKNLNWVKDEMIQFNHLPKSISIDHISNQNEPLIQIVSNLLGENSDPTLLSGGYFNEGNDYSNILTLSDKTRIFACFLYKMILCYQTREHDKGLAHAEKALIYSQNVKGLLFQPLFCYYYALLNYAVAGKKSSAVTHRITGNKYKKMLEKWAQQVPVNFQHRYTLVQAEHARVNGKSEQAAVLYDTAVRLSKENDYCQDEALANELCGNFWMEKSQPRIGLVYIQSAIECYQKWGCEIKVRQLKEQFGEQLRLSPDLSEHGQPAKTGGGSIGSSLDISTLMKASTAISSEVVFARLMEKLMKFAIENAGAQSGFFILDWGGKLYIEASQSVSNDKSDIRQIPLDGSGLVPESIIEHVFRTKTDVILNDAKSDEQFSQDSIISGNDIRSVLCIPAMNQGKIVGVLYLENNLTTGAFTHERTELLKLLSGQIAVSIENSILYENLEKKVAVRTTEIQVQKEEIERQKMLVEEKSKFKEQFFANMSHEIRTPMTAIIGMSELIFDTPLSPRQLEYAKGIRYSSENLLAIINDILDYSKIEAGKFSFVQKPFHIRDRMNRLGYILKVIAEEKGIGLDISVAEDVSDQLIGDPLRLHQILLNLAGNAVKFTDFGSVKIEVKRISAARGVEELVFTVKDTGIGIAKEKLQYIFETFTRLDEDLNSKQTGTGLGLFIAKRLVEEQGGEMTVSSQVQQGTEFSFNLSFEVCGGSEADDNEGRDDGVSLSGTRILLVEDNLFNQVVAEETLKKLIPDVQIVIADNGQIALQKLQEHTFDIVLMDVKMPVMDGYKATRAIREGEKDRRIPILAFTSNANPAEAQKCKEAGMDDYITKPIEAKKLKARIRRLLAGEVV
ncbi:hybrid sensor histidine kinase/response regulator [Dyadobacter alkalitolerans]|uniref:hybrid sensor histidine kinase/response regulator n=1 Tax=Dyadobacter alkalitolerans TaxID=492736 RepID=UPI0004153245|nr:hybrid sensor histidine kinase/response regulator [Dyadobacter alkalitolerans]